MKSEVYKRSMNKRHDLLARNLDAVARIKEHEDQFRQKKKGYLRTPPARCTDVDGLIVEQLL
jgi:hypothetical protein